MRQGILLTTVILNIFKVEIMSQKCLNTDVFYFNKDSYLFLLTLILSIPKGSKVTKEHDIQFIFVSS